MQRSNGDCYGLRKKAIMKQELPDGWTDFRLVWDPLRHWGELYRQPALERLSGFIGQQLGIQPISRSI
jgi:hypothetical protein